MEKCRVKVGEIRDLLTSSGVQKVEIINISVHNRTVVVDWKSTTTNDFGRTIESAFHEPIPEKAGPGKHR